MNGQRTQSVFSKLTVRSAPAYPLRFAAGLLRSAISGAKVIKAMPAREDFRGQAAS